MHFCYKILALLVQIHLLYWQKITNTHALQFCCIWEFIEEGAIYCVFCASTSTGAKKKDTMLDLSLEVEGGAIVWLKR